MDWHFVHGSSVLTVTYGVLLNPPNYRPRHFSCPHLKCSIRQLVLPRHQCLALHQRHYSLSQICCLFRQLLCEIEGKGSDQEGSQPFHLYQHYLESRKKHTRVVHNTKETVQAAANENSEMRPR